jgi:hypothetical protein
MTPEEKRLRYERLKRMIPLVVRRTIKAKDGEIIQGERSLEAQIPDKYKRDTQDYDVYSPSPEQSAEETEKELDWEFGGDYFRVKEGKHKGTYKVVSNIDNEGWADYTKPSERIPKTKIGNTHYTTLKFELEKAIRTLKQKQYAYRHEKERNKIKRLKKTFALQNVMNNKKVKQRWL